MGIYKETRKKTKNNLVEAFWEIYSIKNIEKITIKEITDKAGYNRATFYIYFKDVNDILQYVENKLYDLLSKLDTSANLDYPITLDMLQLAVQIFDANQRYLCVLLSQNGDPHFAVNFKNKLKSHILTCNTALQKHADINTEFVLEYLASGALSCILYWYETKPFSAEDLLLLLQDITMNGPTTLLLQS